MGSRVELKTPDDVLECATCHKLPALSRVETLLGTMYDLTCFKCDYDVSRRTIPSVTEHWNLWQKHKLLKAGAQ
jgi:hypothetical protein